MKYCNRCKKTLPVSNYTKSAKRYDGLQTYCSECMKDYRKEHYQKDKARYTARSKQQKAELTRLMREHKAKPCTDCGIEYPPYVMQFDHIKDNKVANVTKLVQSCNKQALLDEIEKCEVVCANCHAERTYNRRV